MAVTVNARFAQRNDTKANWIDKNPVLIKGEFGVEIDTGKTKIGDGAKDWITLAYSSITLTDLQAAISAYDAAKHESLHEYLGEYI